MMMRFDIETRRDLSGSEPAAVALAAVQPRPQQASLMKVYVEPTNRCNIACRTCIRNAWDVPVGEMSAATYGRVLEGVRSWNPRPLVFFGGLGEPLVHAGIVDMVAQAKAEGASVELITNGTLLTPARSRQLIAAGLDTLWVSIDGATPESYADVRLGAALPQVLANLRSFRRARRPSHRPRPEIGIVFVAMRRNLADLPAVLSLGHRLGATRFIVSNVLPHTAEMCAETLYPRSLSDLSYLHSSWVPDLELPRMDFDPATGRALYAALRSGYHVTFAGNSLGSNQDVCPFLEKGSLSVGWDGRVSPCQPLMYDHVSYLDGRVRRVNHYTIGDLAERSLLDLWADPGHQSFRARVEDFVFAPCTFCGGCDLSEANLSDCMGNGFPTCGGCLWSQGVIRCP